MERKRRDSELSDPGARHARHRQDGAYPHPSRSCRSREEFEDALDHGVDLCGAESRVEPRKHRAPLRLRAAKSSLRGGPLWDLRSGPHSSRSPCASSGTTRLTLALWSLFASITLSDFRFHSEPLQRRNGTAKPNPAPSPRLGACENGCGCLPRSILFFQRGNGGGHVYRGTWLE